MGFNVRLSIFPTVIMFIAQFAIWRLDGSVWVIRQFPFPYFRIFELHHSESHNAVILSDTFDRLISLSTYPGEAKCGQNAYKFDLSDKRRPFLDIKMLIFTVGVGHY